MKTLNISHDEWAWVFKTLTDYGKTLPKHGRFKWGYNATSANLDDLYDRAFSDACWRRNDIWKTVEVRFSEGKWPKIEPELAFWLDARWHGALDFSKLVLSIAAKRGIQANAKPPADGQQAIKTLLLDYWDDLLVDGWLATNLGSYTFTESNSDGGDSIFYEKWLDDVAAGKYQRAKD